MHLNRRHMMSLSAAALGASMLPARAAEQVKFATLGAMDFFAPLLARDEGLFQKNGLDVEVSVATQAPSLLPAVVGGSLQVGVSTGIQVAIANEAGLDVVFVSGAGMLTKSDVNTGLLIRADSELKTPADFVGKKVMVPGINGTYYMLFLRWLKQGNIDPTKVQIVEGGFAQMPDLLRTKQVDAVVNGEPFLSRMLDSGAFRNIDYFKPERDSYVTSFFIAKRSWVDGHRKELDAIRASLRDAVAFSKKDPDAVRSALAKDLKLPPEVTAKQKIMDWRVDLKPEDVQFWADLALEFGLLKGPIDASKLIA